MTMIRKISGRAFVLGLFLSLASLTAMAIDIDVAYARGGHGASGGGTGDTGGAGDTGGTGDAGDDRTYDTTNERLGLTPNPGHRDRPRDEPRDEPRVTDTPILIPAIQEVQVRIEDACSSSTLQDTADNGIVSGWCDEFWPTARRILVAYDGAKAAQGADIVELMRELQERLAAHAEN